MKIIAASFAALFLSGCVGTPVSVTPASRVAVAPTQSFGFHPAATQAAMLPVDATACLVNGGVKVAGDLIDTARCLIGTVLPPVVQVATPQYQMVAPAAAPCVPAAPLPQAAPCAPRAIQCPEPVSTAGDFCHDSVCAVGGAR